MTNFVCVNFILMYLEKINYKINTLTMLMNHYMFILLKWKQKSEQLKYTQKISRKKLSILQKSLFEIKELTGAINSLLKIVEASLKAFDISFNNLHFEETNSRDNFFEATTQKLYDVGHFDSIENRLNSLKIKKPLNKTKRTRRRNWTMTFTPSVNFLDLKDRAISNTKRKEVRKQVRSSNKHRHERKYTYNKRWLC